MIRQHENVNQESIITEFPALTTEEAEELASRIENPAAAANVLDILRNCSAETLATAIAIVFEQMDSHDIEIPHSLETEEQPNFGDSFWDPDDGFTKLRTQVIKMACAALPETGTTSIPEELERLDPWICQMDTMQLTPALRDWQDCIHQSQLWQKHVIERNYDENTARLLGSADGTLAAWNSLADARKMGEFIIVPIQTQAELATEAALNEPDIYPRYINRCIANTARPFTVIEDRTGNTKTLCVLRLRKGRWKLSTPTQLQQDQHTINLLSMFAKDYLTLVHRGGPNSHRSWRQCPEEPVHNPPRTPVPALTPAGPPRPDQPR